MRWRNKLGTTILVGCFLAGKCAHGDTFFVSNHNQYIEKLDSNGNGSPFGSSIPGNPLVGAMGLAFDKNGNLFVAAQRGIFEYKTNGAASVFAQPIGLGGAGGVAFDAKGNLFVAYNTGGTIEKISTNGNATVFVSGLNIPAEIAFNSAGYLFVATQNGIEKFSPSGAETLFASGFSSPSGLAFDKAGNLFVADSGSNRIWKFNSSGSGSIFASNGLSEPFGLAFDSDGNLYVANIYGNTIEKFDPLGNATQFASMGGPTFIAVQAPPPGTLGVYPTIGFFSTGAQGASFSPGTQSYMLTNLGNKLISWGASTDASWLHLSSSSGVLPVGGSTGVTITVNGNASGLTVGVYSNSIIITNLSYGYGSMALPAILTVVPDVPVIGFMPPFSGGTSKTISWATVAGATEYEVQAATSSNFVTYITSGWVSNTQYTFAGLSDGTLYYYRVHARQSFAGPPLAWAQMSNSDYYADTLSGVDIARSPGEVVLQDLAAGRILDPSFEGGAGWTYSQQGPFVINAVNTQYFWLSTPLPTDGTMEMDISSDEATAIVTGEFAMVSQSIDMTGLKAILFDAKLENWDGPLNAQFLIDGNPVWTQVSGGIYTNQSVDVSALTGVHTIEFGSIVVTSGTFNAEFLFLDNLRAISGAYVSSGTIVSTRISPTLLDHWGNLSFMADASAPGASLTVDVLDTNGALLVAGATNGTDLSQIPSIVRQATIQLRANLSTAVATSTPVFSDWAVTYYPSTTAPLVSGWSNIAESTQDATPPSVAVTSPANLSYVTNSIIQITGTGFDASGITSLNVNYIPVMTPDGYLNWTIWIGGLAVGPNVLRITATDGAIPPNTETNLLTVIYAEGSYDGNGDGLPDIWQIRYFGCVTCPQASPDADVDGDGFDNLQKYLAGTDPTNSASAFRITNIVSTGADLLVTWRMGCSKTNSLQVTSGDALGNIDTNYTDLYIVTNTVGTLTNYLDEGAVTNGSSRYYRVRLVP